MQLLIKTVLAFVLLASAQASYCEDIPEAKKLIIDEMLELTGALEVGEMMGVAVANQVIAAMTQHDKNIDPKVVTIVQEEVGRIMHDEFIANGFINEMSYTIYHKHFTIDDLQQMVAFYKTPIGKKMASLLPQVTQEGMIAGQKHGQSLGPLIQERLRARFEKEGIK